MAVDRVDHSKPKVKPIRFNFELRETSPLPSETEEDDEEMDAHGGLIDPNVGREAEMVEVIEEDFYGRKIKKQFKNYILTPVRERIGCYVNLDNKYYQMDSIK